MYAPASAPPSEVSMVRKTKEEALVTRTRILDAAEHLFEAQGVSRTSLHDIAVQAGVTRGAVYWHFKDKSDLFIAMMDRVCMPMEDAAQALGRDADAAVLPAVRAQLLDIFSRVVRNAQVRRVFEIATHKVEYVGELAAVRERHLAYQRDYLATLERALRHGQRSGEIVARPTAKLLALGIHAVFDGLVQSWILDPTAFDLMVTGAKVLDVYMAGMTPR